MDADRVADGLVFACATRAEQRAGRRAGLRTALIGLAGANGIPEGELVSFGLAGALDGLASGTVVDATQVVDESGRVLWQGEQLGVAGAFRGTILAAGRVVDEAAERARLYAATGADAADLESGPLAETGRLRGVLRVVGDTPGRPLDGIVAGVAADGSYDWRGLARAFVCSPRGFAAAASDAARALRRLTDAARRWSR